MQKTNKIYLAGHKGLVGSAIYRKLTKEGFTNIITRTHKELDLTIQKDVEAFFEEERPDYVFLSAAKVGGILANSTYPAEFMYQNLMISTNVIHASYKYNVKKLLNLGSSCIYPKLTPQPMKEGYLLTSSLEKTNEAYALAKISAIKMCEYYNRQYDCNFISAMPTNQYGINDNFNMETAHLLPMLMRRFYLAKLYMEGNIEVIKKDLRKNKIGYGWGEKIDFSSKKSIEEALNYIGVFKNKAVCWGDGSVFRELMHSDDLADGLFYLMKNVEAKSINEASFVNITKGTDIQLKELIPMVANIVDYKGKIEFDTSKPNGTPRKLMDATKIKRLGWKPKIPLEDGIRSTFEWYLENINA